MKVIDVAEQFSKNPYGRYPEDGNYNGQRFRDEFLVPALKSNEEVKVDLSGTNRYGSSFLEEAFGGLVRENIITKDELLSRLTIVHKNLPSLVESCYQYIKNAKPKRI